MTSNKTIALPPDLEFIRPFLVRYGAPSVEGVDDALDSASSEERDKLEELSKRLLEDDERAVELLFKHADNLDDVGEADSAAQIRSFVDALLVVQGPARE